MTCVHCANTFFSVVKTERFNTFDRRRVLCGTDEHPGCGAVYETEERLACAVIINPGKMRTERVPIAEITPAHTKFILGRSAHPAAGNQSLFDGE